jgi:CCR4-NOT transcriptional complex subunit CAF120
LPTRSNDEQPLQNILSISTAGRNRYLLHFNSHHSLIQWTAGIRLAMFEHSTLQEAYTGSLIAGKGKTLNNINLIMDRARVPVQEWVRVRFGAGVPWRRCWCVISPPDEKEYQKMQKDLKKRSPYDRSHVPILKGDIKFYDTKIQTTKKQKKAKPIASIADAFSAYALYPQAKSLIDASTLIKIEGNITIHSDPPSSTEGFVFIMPEVHPAVTGFEMLLRFLFPTWDTFGLYGRPGRLVASVLDSRSLMFAMPKHKRYGYLEILDVTGLILNEGSSTWTERDWRKKLKELTGARMTAVEEGSKGHARSGSRSSKRLSMGPSPVTTSRPRVNFADDTPERTSRSVSLSQQGPRTDSAPPAHDRQRASPAMTNMSGHARNASDTRLDGPLPMRPSLDVDGNSGRPSPVAKHFPGDVRSAPTPDRLSSDEELPSHRNTPVRDIESYQRMQTPEPVHAPPAFAHGPSSKPAAKPYHSPELRRANSRLSSTTLAQLAKAGGVPVEHYPGEHPRYSEEGSPYMHSDPRGPAVHPQTHHNPSGMPANHLGSREALTPSPATQTHDAYRQPSGVPPHLALRPQRSHSPSTQPNGRPGYSPQPGQGPASRPSTGSRPNTPDARGPQIPPHQQRPGFQQNDLRASPLQGGPAQAMGDPRSGAPQAQPLLLRDSGSNGPPGHYQGPAGRGGPPPHAYGHPQYGPPHGPPPQLPQGRRTPPPGGMPPHVNISPPINRKPLPQRTTSLQREQEPPSASSSNSSLKNYYIDESALARVHPPDDSDQAPRQQVQRQQTQRSEASSQYDDVSSTASPDYASTRKSSETQASVERPRAGVLKTVGDVNQNPLPAKPIAASFDIPEINFGPTLNYAAQGSPGRKTPTPMGGTPPAGSQPSGGSFFPATGRKSPGGMPGDQAHFRTDSDDTIRRSVAWQPGSVAVGSVNERSGAMTPEQFVQQRAAAATIPLHSHQRQSSGNMLTGSRNNTPTPPLKRNSSYDMLNTPGGHSRSGSADLLSQRPASQGAGNALGVANTSHLSAREQEHLAKMTGAPLITMASSKPVQQGGPGLVGAIAAREREKQQMKEGVSSQAVQHAINQRQQQQEQQFQAQYAQHYRQQQQQFLQQQMAQQAQLAAYGLGPGPVVQSSPTAPSMYAGNMGGPTQQMGNQGYQLPPGHGPPQSRPTMGTPPGSFGPGSPQPGRNASQTNIYRPGPQQGFTPQQGLPPQGVQQPPRSGTPGSMARMHQGQGGQAY